MIKAEHLNKFDYTLTDMDSVKSRKKELRLKGSDPDMLSRCEAIWMNMDEVRHDRSRCRRFTYEDQWGDMIEVNGKRMTYRQYLLDTGNMVIQANQIKTKVETVVGQMVKEQMEPVCHSIDREEQQYGEVVTAGLQANCNKNQLMELKKQWVRELCLGGLAVSYESYDSYSGPSNTPDSWTKFINPNYFFFDSEAVDPRFWDATIVGRFYYGSFEEICAQFAHSPNDYRILRDIYSSQASPFRREESREIADRFEEGDLVFMKSADTTRCYVCEVWTKEQRPRIRLWDKNSGEEEIIDADDEAYRKEIRAENQRRRNLAKKSGFTEEETPYIVGDGFGNDPEEKNGFFMETIWYFRFLAPDGTILFEGESPYADKSHPFSVCMFPMIDGRLKGYMYDVIDYNFAMNRAVVLHDWLLRAQQKGMTVVPKSILGDVTPQQFAKSWTSIDDILFLDIDESKKDLFPQVFHGPAQTFDVGNLLATYSRLMDQGSPVNAALQGKTPNSGTSGALYAQMTTNASTPIAALLDAFNKFIETLLYKKMKNLVMFYTPDRWEKIAGQVDGFFGNQNLNLNDIPNIEYDLTIKESSDTPVFRAIINQDAKEFLLNGLISFEEYLEIADVPYADKILQGRQAREAEMEAAQQGIPSGGGAPVELNVPEPEAPGLVPGVHLPKPYIE